MYESCFINADQLLTGAAMVLVVLCLGLICALDRQTYWSRHWRELYRDAANDARIFKRERDQARIEHLFPDRRNLHG